jgi:hypothetical protein
MKENYAYRLAELMLGFVGVFNRLMYMDLVGEFDSTRRFFDGLSWIGLMWYK